MSELFYCYSRKLKHFLKMNNLSYVSRGTHPNGNYYWCFRKSQKLNEVLELWKRYKKIF